MENGVFFGERLLEWYRVHKRDLPWRRSKNPYYIWVSEIMLQQTRVETVKPYFERFISKFPTVEALADAPEEEVLKAWEGLGYYSRARNLQTAVREVREKYAGEVPNEPEQVAALKGVGPYTAGAILSIAFNKPEPAVDGNVMRVLSRFFYMEDDIAKSSTRVKMEGMIRQLIPEGTASDFNQALMELGATVCTPKTPHCLTCPVMERCAGRLEGAEMRLPVKTKAKPPKPEQRFAILAMREDGAVLVRQRPETGLLARMWELPHWKVGAADGITQAGTHEYNMVQLQEALAQDGGPMLEPDDWFLDTEHTFSHIHWDMRVYRFTAEAGGNANPGSEQAGGARPSERPAMLEMAAAREIVGAVNHGPSAEPALRDSANPEQSGSYRWITQSEMKQLAFPNVFLRILKHAFV
ncbi:A/G-specific adenine glycosylase [Paenibacillus turpanensis]|uniref:A/G-specific adenine glycosylase n=1 Tax=Paenibacillus turpanensis TaxID=2689078 RepID=UPI00140AB150|nr:A/G-specific adenine glycosylase [Paenibacillus turpanensis]